MPTNPLCFGLGHAEASSPRSGVTRDNSHSSRSINDAVGGRLSARCSSRVIGRLSSVNSFTNWCGVPLFPITDTADSEYYGNLKESTDGANSSGYLAAKSMSYRGDATTCCGSERIPFSSESPRVGNSPIESASTHWRAEVPQMQEEVQLGPQGSDVAQEAYLADGMPQGRFILLNLLTTWGDVHEVGLNGVEIFDENGERIIPLPQSIEDQPWEQEQNGQQQQLYHEREVESAIMYGEKRWSMGSRDRQKYTAPHGRLHVIVEYPVVPGVRMPAVAATAAETEVNYSNESDFATADIEVEPRHRVENIVNGIHNTHDDSKLFTMPFTPQGHHLIGFLFPTPVVISMVRVHNYSGRGRVHTSKGVRLLEMTVDDTLVFRGTIAPNSGDVVQPHRIGLENCENILFSEEERVLRRILAYSATVTGASMHGDSWNVKPAPNAAAAPPRDAVCRTTTTVLFTPEKEDKALQFGGEKGVLVPAAFPANAPAVQALSSAPSPPYDAASAPAASSGRHSRSQESTTNNNGATTGSGIVGGVAGSQKNVTSVCLMLLGTWGDTETIGLSGLRFRDAQGSMVSHRISQWYVRFPSQRWTDDDDDGTSCDTWTKQLIYLFDENADTAVTLPCERGIEIIFLFEAPLPTLGFVEVANYSLGEHTFCGVKEARLFLSSSSVPCTTPSSLVAAYAALWDPDSNFSRSVLAANGIFEVTPEEGVSLRKAPAFLSIPRFQVYDLSPAVGDISSFACGNDAVRASRSKSLSASMTIRTEMALRRARMMLKPRPEWLLEYQPYLTPLLPVAYVLKVSLLICARGPEELKNYAKLWVMKPLRACKFADENGERIRVHGAKRTKKGGHADVGAGERGISSSSSSSDRTRGGYAEVPNCFVAECLFTPLPTPMQQDAEVAAVAAQTGARAPLLHAALSLVYVADSPFCVSIVALDRPLVAEGRMAWVKQVRILMDDTLVFDSGEIGMPHLSSQPPSFQSSGFPSFGEDQLKSPTKDGNSGSTPTSAHEQLPSAAVYTTRLKPLVFFTLDAAVLDEVRTELALL